MNWFDVDRQGLAAMMLRRGKEAILWELLQNAIDADARNIAVELRREAGGKYAEITVTDDSPGGFADLSHAYTMFAPSARKGDPEKRGRWNFGEKHALSLLRRASIESTTGTVIFDEKGRRRTGKKTASGTVFHGEIKLSLAEFESCREAVWRVLLPDGVRVTFNGEEVPRSEPLAVARGGLATEIAGADGVMKRTTRMCDVEIHDPRDGRPACLYEMGLPVVETGDRWDVNVLQKVPMSIERDSVSPSYLARIRALVVDAMRDRLDGQQANSAWVKDAIMRHGDELHEETVKTIAELRFGAKRVAFDPSDKEANGIAASQGYQVVHGSQLSGTEWAVFKAAGAIEPAGRVTPSPKPYGNGPERKTLDRSKWTRRMRAVAAYAERVGRQVLGRDVGVEIVSDVGWPFAATYGAGNLTLNLGRLGHAWFDGEMEQINRLLIHEFSHEYGSDHLSEEFYRGLERVGAAMTKAALRSPDLFRIDENTTFVGEARERDASLAMG